MRFFVFLLAVGGFFVAKYIRDHKERDVPLVCMVGFDCHSVVHSDYSKIFNIRVEILGMLYYALVAIAYLFFISFEGVLPNLLVGFVALTSLLAFLFSLYLIGVQFFILKKGCSWCLVSAGISVGIFILTALTYDFTSLYALFDKVWLN